eukprot:TRINITY_DN90915_c0_g1_i1.p1 TRINITY_DN90915_c0_g1~~TRINITY_DN90915_c0_g1_i1.p1  ORF type:complete len:1762 (-),score=363.66 TRINITY_DN90915_c0_g1_i1:47-5332(-)
MTSGVSGQNGSTPRGQNRNGKDATRAQPAAQDASNGGSPPQRKGEAAWEEETRSQIKSARELRLQLSYGLSKPIASTGTGAASALQALAESVPRRPPKENGNVASQAEGNASGDEKTPRLKSVNRLKHQISSHEQMAQELCRRIDIMDNLSLSLGHTIFLLQKAAKKQMWLDSATDKRLQARSNRPEEELVQDGLQSALEHEKKVVRRALKDIDGLETSSNQVLDSVKSLRCEMNDARISMHDTLKTDRVLLLQWFDATSRMQESSRPGTAASTASGKNLSSKELVGMADRLEADVEKHTQKSQARLADIEHVVEKATSRTYRCMRHQIDELRDLRQQLEGELRATRQSIFETEKTKEEAETSLEKLKHKDLDNKDTRLNPEDQAELKAKLLERHSFAVDMLSQLRDTEKQLVESLHCKTVAWKADVACFRVTPGKTAARAVPNKFEESMESSAHSESDDKKCSKRRRRAKKLAPRAVELVRSRIKAAAYVWEAGCQLETVFNKMDADHSGSLDDQEVRKALRMILRIPPLVISDAEIDSLCATLDSDNLGLVSIEVLRKFIEGDTSTHKQEQHFQLNDLCRHRAHASVTQVRKESIERARSRLKSCAYTGVPGSPGPSLESLFRRMDKDKSGQLDLQEVKTAMRRILRIPPRDVSDLEITVLYNYLDKDGSGTVSIAEMVSFAESEAEFETRDTREATPQPPEPMPEPKLKPLARKRGQPLDPQMLEVVRSRVKSAAYCGPCGSRLDVIFGRLDADGTGELDDDEVRRAVRRLFRIPPQMLSDADISALCASLDKDKNGTVSISEFLDFIGPPSPVLRKVARKATLPPVMKKPETPQLGHDRPATHDGSAASRPNGGISESNQDANVSTDSLEAAGQEKIPIFSIVRLAELKVRTEFNGKFGVVVPECLSTSPRHPGSIKAFLDSQTEVVLKPACAELLESSTDVPLALRALEEKLRQDYDVILVKIRTSLRGVVSANEKYASDTVLSLFGANGEGGESTILSYKEVKEALRCKLRIPATVLSDAEVATLIEQLDPKGTKNIAVRELSRFIEEQPRKPRHVHVPLSAERGNDLRDRLRSAVYLKHAGVRILDKLFKCFDINRSGLLSFDEARKALRRGLRVTKKVVSDEEIQELCAALDTKGSGVVNVADLAIFIGKEQPDKLDASKDTYAESTDFESYSEDEQPLSKDCPPEEEDWNKKPTMPRTFSRAAPQALDEEVLHRIRSRIKAAAYTASGRYKMDAMFKRLDVDRTGHLEPEELRSALRRTMRIPESQISNEEIMALGHMLDADNSGTIDVHELVAFVATERKRRRPPQSVSCDTASSRGGSPDVSDRQLHSAREPRRPKGLSQDLMDKIRSRMKAAAYTGPGGKRLDIILGRFDYDNSGFLEPHELRTAMRRTLKIPASDISDDEIRSLCHMLDADNSGTVSIAEVMDFVEADEPSKNRSRLNDSSTSATRSTSAGADQSSELDASSSLHATTEVTRARPKPVSLPRRPKMLDQQTLERIRSQMKAAAYTTGGRQLDLVFSRFDYDRSGELEPDEVRRAMRRTLRIPEDSISDKEILSFCAVLDKDRSGSVSIQEIVDFVGFEPTISKRTGRAIPASGIGDHSERPATSDVSRATSSAPGMPQRPATSPPSSTRPVRAAKPPPKLEPEVLQKIQSRLKAASYAGTKGRCLETIFKRFDTDGSGRLEADEVRRAMRRTLRIAQSVISDEDIKIWLSMLDSFDEGEKDGSVSVSELVAFVDLEIPNPTRSEEMHE